MWDSTGTRVTRIHPSDVAAEAGTTLGEWLTGMEVIAEAGLMAWDTANRAHYLSSPSQSSL